MQPTSPLRDLVADTALRLGADAPTLCTPWTVQEILAHLVVRESRPDALPGIGVDLPPFAAHTDRVQAQRAQGSTLGELAEAIRSGPPRFWPTRLPALDRAVNTAELAIHHEDMVRAQESWEPTDLAATTQQDLWQALTLAGRLLYRSAPVGVVAVAEGFGRRSLRRPPRDVGSVVLHGTPLELVLHAFGRTEVAMVEVRGADQDIAALAEHRRSV